MSHLSVPLTAISLTESISDVPLEDRAVVSLDQNLDYQRVMRADMVQSYNEDGWRLVPTPDTLKAIETMLRHNARADDNSRKVFTEEFPGPNHEYELIPAALKLEGRRPTIYIDVGEATPRAFNYPYSDLPTVKSRAHPFFVLDSLEGFMLGGARLLRYPWMRPYRQAALRVSGLWRGTPPVEFRYGSALPLEHRHPGSIKGDTDSPSRQDSCDADTHDSNGASPDPEGRSGAVDADHHSHSTSSLGKRKRAIDNPADLADARPRLCPRLLESERTKDLYTRRSAVVAWITGIESCDPVLRSAPASAIAEADAQLERYVQEPCRDPLEVMRTGKRISPTTIPLGQERDTSRFTSCNWAEQKYCIYLWGYRDVSRQP
ncbi:hypothetical protein GGF50DRAFT_63895 [Schizophyllum commune]